MQQRQLRDELAADVPLDSNVSRDETKPDVISNAINGSNGQNLSKPDIISIQDTLTHVYHKPIGRTVSLGSWNSNDSGHRFSGRFSVSPVNLEVTEPQVIVQTEDTPVVDSNDSQTQSNYANETASEGQNNTLAEAQGETSDQLMELPKHISKNLTFLSPEGPNKKTIRRMSSPNLSQTTSAKPKVRPLSQLKQCINLESLDLKSSLPISPTFFARFGKNHIILNHI